MRKLKANKKMRPFIYLFFLSFLFACGNEFDIIEEEKDIPVVYGFLSISDTAQYIRVERAFVDENTSALELAQNPDSIYYPELSVELVRNSSGQRFSLERVDGNLEGYEREEGVFAQAPNYLYKIKSSDINLAGGESYSLVIDRGENFPLIEATTNLLSQTSIKTPNPSTAVTIDFDYIDRNLFIWSAGDNASIHDLVFRINYRERSPETNGQFVSKFVLWRAVRNYKEEDSRVDVEIDGINFYTFLKGALEVKSDVERRFEDMDMIITSGGEEIKDFVNITSANLGITSTQDVPVFSNIPGGQGIFSSTNTVILDKISLSNMTIDSLKNGMLTKSLNFTN